MKKFAVAALAMLCVPGVAYAQDEEQTSFDGVRIEARLGYETPTVSDGSGNVYKVGSAVSFGGEVGYDINTGGKVTVGPYANYELSSVKVCDGPDCLSEKGNWSAGGRIAFVVSPKVAIYGKVGYNSMRLKATSGALTGSETQGGVGGSLGVEVSLQKNFYAFVDGSYADYGDFFGINLQRRQVAAGLGVRF
jgi:outer membrane immunogenic protein